MKTSSMGSGHAYVRAKFSRRLGPSSKPGYRVEAALKVGRRSTQQGRCIQAVPAPYEDMNWDELAFDLSHVGQKMYLGRCSAGGEWQGGITDYAPLPLDPAAQVLSYGQAIIEGLKAQRTAKGDIAIFRPQAHAERMRSGAERMCMPGVPEAMFVDAVEQTVRANACLVPPMGTGVLYVRPLLLGTAPRLGVGPASAYTFVVFCAAVGNYYKGQDQGADLLVENDVHRGAPGGVGATKCAGNYAAVLQAQQQAKRAGFTDVLLLDCASGDHLEEASAGNVFIVSGNQVKTPRLKGTFLAGVTRSSILQMLRDEGYEATEEDVSVADAMEADEMFISGTAAGVCLTRSLTFEGFTREFPSTAVASRMKIKLEGIQQMTEHEGYDWMLAI